MKYYLFGHYDSRGGASLVRADSPEDAKRKYAAIMNGADPRASWQEIQKLIYDEEDWAREAAEDDFLGEVTPRGDDLPGEAEVGVGLELDWKYRGNFAIFHNQDLFKGGEPIEIWFRRLSDEERDQIWNFDPDPDQIPKPNGVPDDFTDSELGEDAYGLVLC